MEKKLPKIYANKVEKTHGNNSKVAYSSSDEIRAAIKENNDSKIPVMNINQKLNQIFNSTRYVYKADVVIVTKDGTINRKIIGQNNTHLITIDNELIPIADIVDIHFAD